MPMIRALFPDNWDQISAQVKWAAGWKCEVCGKRCRKPGEPFDTHERTLTCVHKNHKQWDCRRENVAALCAPCQLDYVRSLSQRKRWFQAKLNGRRQDHVGLQLCLFASGLKIGRAIHEYLKRERERKLEAGVPGESDSQRKMPDDLVSP